MKRFIAFILLVVMLTLGFTSCTVDERMGTGASDYLDERDTTGRRIFFAEFCFVKFCTKKSIFIYHFVFDNS